MAGVWLAIICQQIASLAAELDDEYIRLNEEGDGARSAEMLLVFSKARAAFAVVFAISADSGGLHEAIYEAVMAVDDAARVVQPVSKILGS